MCTNFDRTIFLFAGFQPTINLFESVIEQINDPWTVLPGLLKLTTVFFSVFCIFFSTAESLVSFFFRYSGFFFCFVRFFVFSFLFCISVRAHVFQCPAPQIRWCSNDPLDIPAKIVSMNFFEIFVVPFSDTRFLIDLWFLFLFFFAP